MCMSCGCGQGNDDHGEPRNITAATLVAAAAAAGLTIEQVAANIRYAVETNAGPASDYRSSSPPGSELAIN